MGKIGSKEQLRAQLRARRSSIGEEEIRKKSIAAQKWLIDSDEFNRAKTIALYKACFGEVDTDDIFSAARSFGKTALYPRTDKKRGALDFGVVDNLDSLVPGAWNIPEPPAESRWAPLDQADLVILPGVAFDRNGARLGMGGGFYDRMLANLNRKTVRMGLAYDFQVVDIVPMDTNDQRIDRLVTESGLLRFTERG